MIQQIPNFQKKKALTDEKKRIQTTTMEINNQELSKERTENGGEWEALGRRETKTKK